MEEARRLLARLERLETLDREQASPDTLLSELRALLDEADAWARAEPDVPPAATAAVRRCRRMLEDAGRTLLA